MKIAIMTQPLGHNYGGIMQAYALQKVLKDMGHEVVTINYHAPSKGLVYNLTRLGYRFLKKIMGKRKAPINFEKYYPYIFKETQSFIDQYITLSEYIDNERDLKSHFDKNNYDAVIVGSDQTWRPMYSPNIYSYYLDFLENNKDIKKIAYASSFGVDTWEYSDEQTRRCAELANLFDAISVREQSGVDLCDKYLGVKSEFVLDPTLLLSKDDYLVLIGDRYKRDQEEGVFSYFLDSNQEKENSAKQVATMLDTHVFRCYANISLSLPISINIDDYKMPSVANWLASFANAQYIITDSFHGMVFSIIFNKPFMVLSNSKRGGARFKSLADLLSIHNSINDNCFIKDFDLLFDFDYSSKAHIINKYANSSFLFLRGAIDRV